MQPIGFFHEEESAEIVFNHMIDEIVFVLSLSFGWIC